MPSVSKSQQRLFGMASASKKGVKGMPKKAKDIAKSLSKKKIDKYAKTPHKGLPERVPKNESLKLMNIMLEDNFIDSRLPKQLSQIINLCKELQTLSQKLDPNIKKESQRYIKRINDEAWQMARYIISLG